MCGSATFTIVEAIMYNNVAKTVEIDSRPREVSAEKGGGAIVGASTLAC